MSDDPSGARPDASHESSFAPEAKFSIRHLMVWGVCVALYCSVYQSIECVGDNPFPIKNVFFAGSYAMLFGTALAGLLLLFIRRRRGLIYPRHGGEWLWSIAGIQAAITLVDTLLVSFARLQVVSFLILPLPTLVVLGLAFLFAIVRSEDRRWKAVFFLIPAATIGTVGLIGLAATSLPVAEVQRWVMAVSAGRTLLLFAPVAIAALIDLRQTQRYPWTHWAGILLYCWQSATLLASYVLFLIFA